MLNAFLNSCKAFLFFTIICGVIYPVLITAIGSTLLPSQSAGSLATTQSGQIVGSKLLAQKTTSLRYFWPRPSAADFTTVASGASNLSPSSQDFKDQVVLRSKALQSDIQSVPADLLMTSASGLDPHISMAAAKFQALRVANARGIALPKMLDIISEVSIPANLFWQNSSDRIVNVLELNLTLDSKETRL